MGVPTSISITQLSSFSSITSFSTNLYTCYSHSLLTSFVSNSNLHYPRKTNRSLKCNCSTLSTITLLTPPTETMLFSIFQAVGLNEKETEALLTRNAPLKFVPINSIRKRIQTLQALGVTGPALTRLILKRSDVLIAEEIDSLLAFFISDTDLNLRGKIEVNQIERLVSTTKPILLYGFERKVRMLIDQGIPQEKLVHVLNNTNLIKALCLKSVGEIERMFTYLKHFGGADLIVRRPALLAYDLDTQMIPRIGFLFELSGRDESSTSTVLRKLPFILAYSVDHLKDHVEFLKSFAGLTEEEIFKVVLIYPNLFSASRVRKLHPRIDFLKQCGLSSNDIFKFLIKAPLFVSLSFEQNLGHKLVFLLKVGYQNKTKELAMAMGAVTRTSCINLQKNIGVFVHYGLTCDDIFEMSKKHPQVLQYNHESLDEKMDYLIHGIGREVKEVLAFPAFLGYKLDSRIKHRYEAKKSILGEGMSLNKLLSVSVARFSVKSKMKKVET